MAVEIVMSERAWQPRRGPTSWPLRGPFLWRSCTLTGLAAGTESALGSGRRSKAWEERRAGASKSPEYAGLQSGLGDGLSGWPERREI